MQCDYHGLVFDGSGTCVDNPGEALNPIFCVRAFPIKERQNFIWIWMGNPARADQEEILEYAYYDMMEEFNYNCGHYEIAANYMFMMDNLMDLTHLRYLHTSTIGGNPDKNNSAEMTTT
jgi:phenylpropionate dioxygenase-like ring-hydroxylating dioxygenase large terminal subunit